MSKTNFLVPQIDYAKINRDFDIVKVVNGNNKSMYYVADYTYDNALSVTHETGAVMYILYSKGGYNPDVFSNEIGSKVYSHELISPKELEKHMLIRLFMNRINNFLDNKLSFNNLAGNLFFYDLSSMKKSGFKAFKVEIQKEKNVDDMLYLNIVTMPFIYKSREELEKYHVYKTLYTFSDVEHNFLRKATKDEQEGYIQKGFRANPAKSKFMVLPKKEDIENEVFNTSYKVYYYHHTIVLFNEYNKGYIQLAYKDVPSVKSKLPSPQKIDQIVYRKALQSSIYFVNKVGEDELTSLLEENLSQLFKTVNIVEEPVENELNLILVHSPEYYEDEDDPYKETKKHIPCQHLVYEKLNLHTSVKEKNGEIKYSPSLLNSIKELFIKYDILVNKRITIEEWTDRAYICDFSFTCVQEELVYTLDIQPNGCLYFKEPVLLKESQYKDYLEDSKADYLVISPAGDMNTIKRTEGIIIPNEEAIKTTSKANIIKDTVYDGVFDLHMHNIDGNIFYSSGMDNKLFKFEIKNAVHLYKVNDFGYRNLYEDLMRLCAVSFINQQGPSVLPYPFKYLREYISMNTINKKGDNEND